MPRKSILFLLLNSLTALCFAADDRDQLTVLQRDVDLLRTVQVDIQKNIAIIKDLLMGKKPLLDGVFIDISGRPAIGSTDAKIVIVEFSDFQCSFCASYHHDTFRRIVEEYVKTGKVRYVSLNFPLDQSHPLAEKAAEAAFCAGAQGKYWEAHDFLFAPGRSLASEALRSYADSLGLDSLSFTDCLESKEFAGAVARDVANGKDMGVRGTPTFFIGFAEPGKVFTVRARISLVGDAGFQEFQRAIAEALAELGGSANTREDHQ